LFLLWLPVIFVGSLFFVVILGRASGLLLDLEGQSNNENTQAERQELEVGSWQHMKNVTASGDKVKEQEKKEGKMLM
jgi:hypothetical protein